MEAIFAVSAMQRPHLTESSYVNALRMRSCSTLGGCHAASVLKPVSADFEAQCNVGELLADNLLICCPETLSNTRWRILGYVCEWM